MKVKDLMTKDPFTIGYVATLGTAIATMRAKGAMGKALVDLRVVRDGRLPVLEFDPEGIRW